MQTLNTPELDAIAGGVSNEDGVGCAGDGRGGYQSGAVNPEQGA